MGKIIARFLDNGLESKLRLTSHYRHPVPGDSTLAVRRVCDHKGLDRVIVIDKGDVVIRDTKAAKLYPIVVDSRVASGAAACIEFTKEPSKRVKS